MLLIFKHGANVKNKISYLKDCFIADNRTNALHDIFSNKIEQRLFIKNAELFLAEGHLELTTEKYGTKVTNELSLYIKEKDFKASLFFLKTEQNILGKIKDVYIPILSYSASIIFDDFLFSSCSLT